jgi:hypothetical protein
VDAKAKLKSKKKGQPTCPISPPRCKEKKKPEFTYCVSRGIRHSYTPFIRDISTPEWSDSRSEITAKLAPEEKFNMIHSHEMLETYEYRIQNGMDREHLHPAMALTAFREGNGLVRSAFESSKTEKYESVEIQYKIPRYWPERAWDSPDRTMSVEHSQKLYDFLSNMQMAGVNAKVMSPKIPATPRPKKLVKKMSRANGISLHRTNFMTDEEDDTEWDDF